jgi:hypothetical protein
MHNQEVPMKRTAQSIHARLLLFGTVGLLGCGSEKIDADITYLSTSDASAAAHDTWLEIIFAPDLTTTLNNALGSIRLRIDGRWVLNSPEDPQYLTLLSWGGYYRPADNLISAPHVFEFVDSHGEVRLSTEALELSPDRANQLFVYGDKDSLAYAFFANTDAELAAIPSGMVLGRAINLRPDRQAFPLRTCPAGSIDIGECALVAEALSYGQVWQAVVPRETALGIPCSPDTPDTLCQLSLAPTCYPGPTQPPVAAQITLYSWVYGSFESHEIPHSRYCESVSRGREAN